MSAQPAPTETPFIPALILRNKGVPISLKRVDSDGSVIADDEGTPLTVEVYLKFDANAIAEIEDHFDGFKAKIVTKSPVVVRDPLTGDILTGPDGAPVIQEMVVDERETTFYGLEGFQQAMEVKQTKTTRDAIAIALGLPFAEVGARLLEGETATYAAQVGIAWSIANGVDPTQAARTLQRALSAVAAQRDALGAEMEKEILGVEDATPGTSGSAGGARRTARRKTSGA